MTTQLRTDDRPGLSRKESARTLLARVDKLMLEEKIFLDGKLTLDGLAASLGITRARLSHAVNSTTGLNFVQYVNAHRIREAIRIMLDPHNTDKNIDTIYEEVGFNSHSPFYQTFKKITGLTPAEFRRAHHR